MNGNGKPLRQASAHPVPQKFRTPRRNVRDLLDPDVLDDETRRLLMNDVVRPRMPLMPPSPSASPLRPGDGSPRPSRQQSAAYSRQLSRHSSGIQGEDQGVFPSQLRSKVKTGSDELVTVMAARLTDLEKKHRVYQLELKEMGEKNNSLREQVRQELRSREEMESTIVTLYDEKKDLEAELEGIKQFLASQGIAWHKKQVDHSNQKPSSPRVKNTAAQAGGKDDKFDLYAGDYSGEFPDELNCSGPIHFHNTALLEGAKIFNGSPLMDNNTPRSSLSPGLVDVPLLIKNARILSDYVGYKGVTTDGRQGAIRERDVVRVVIYKNGICVNGGAFRPFGWALCDAFTQDLAEGFYPYEFKEKYPDGFPIEVVDQSAEVCDVHSPTNKSAGANAPSGHRLGGVDPQGNVHTLQDQQKGGYQPVSKEEFLRRVPERTVTANGHIVNVRAGVAAAMGIKQPDAVPSMDTMKHVTPAENAFRTKKVEDAIKSSAAGNTAEKKQGDAALPAPPPPMILGDLVAVLIRLPSGQKVSLHMSPGNTIKQLREEVMKAAPGLEQGGQGFELCQAFPPKTFTDREQTLQALGLTKTCTLMIKQTRK